MANYTLNYRLHQWVESDPFLRTDFNEDFAAIDAALGRAERGAETANRNLYELLLRDYYEGKDTGWKQGLYFEGFNYKPDWDQLTKGFFWDDAAQKLTMDSVRAPDQNLSFGTAVSQTLAPKEYLTIPWTASGSGWLDKFQIYVTGGGWSGLSLVLPNGLTTLYLVAQAEGNAVFTTSDYFIPRGNYKVKITNASDNIHTIYSGKAGTPFGFRSSMRSDLPTQGAYTSRALDHGRTLRGVQGWVRFQGGSVAPHVQVDGVWLPANVTSTYPSATHDGETCSESAFALDFGKTTSAPLTFRIDVKRDSDKSFYLLDYGVALL